MLYAQNKEDKNPKTPSGRINTPEDAKPKSFAPPELFKDEEEEEKENDGLSATEKVEEKALEKKKRKGI